VHKIPLNIEDHRVLGLASFKVAAVVFMTKKKEKEKSRKQMSV
jgi:hypothetical protein